MYRIAWAVVISMLAVVPSFAAEMRCGVSASRLPDSWTVVQPPQTRDGLCSAVYGATNHKASVIMGLGEARGLSAGDLARDVAALLDVHPEREEHLDNVRFWTHRGAVPVVCTVHSNEREFRFACIVGDEATGNTLGRLD